MNWQVKFDDKLIDEFANSAGCIQITAAPKVLYHYTSAEVLSKIVKNQELWCTHILEMRNDPKEFSHGLDLFIDGLTALEDIGLDTVLGGSLKKFIDKEKVDPHVPSCVFCLSPVRDDRILWEQYGNDGTGVSVGFHSHIFVEPRNVIYEPDRQKAIVDRVNDQFVELVHCLHRNGKDLNDSKTIQAMALAYFRVAYMQALRFKHQSWKVEPEWRGIVLKKSTELLSYFNGIKSIRYFPMKIDLSTAICEVILGPRFKSGEIPSCIDKKIISKSGLNI